VKTESKALLDKAVENIRAITILTNDGIYSIAIGRAYYAMFYCAEAVLLEQGLEFSSHGEVHGAFGRELIKTGKLPNDLHQYLLEAFRRRQSADYDAPAEVTREDALRLFEQAQSFYETVFDFLQKN